jgi:hypothetical protein
MSIAVLSWVASARAYAARLAARPFVLKASRLTPPLFLNLLAQAEPLRPLKDLENMFDKY